MECPGNSLGTHDYGECNIANLGTDIISLSAPLWNLNPIPIPSHLSPT